MGLIDELFSKSTGMKSLLGDQINTPISKESLGGGGRSYDPNQQAISQDEFYQKKADDNKQRGQQISDYLKPEPFDPKKLGSGSRGYNIDIPNGEVPPAETDAEDGITNYAKADPKGFFKMFGQSLEQMSANWKDKGGFEALMANPAFTVGAALLKSGSQGKSIGAGAIDSLVTGGAISKQYADQIKARSKVLAPISQDQRDSVAAVLAEDNYYEPNFLESLAKGNQSAKFRESLDDIADRADKLAKIESRQKGGKEIRYGRKHIRQALKQLEDEGVLKKRDPSFFGIIGGSIQSKKGIKARAEGGPIQSGQDYVVGEEGPEMFVSETNGTIINNDDSKVVSMLLESNPQLKNVSKARAVKILKARFPDYF